MGVPFGVRIGYLLYNAIIVFLYKEFGYLKSRF